MHVTFVHAALVLAAAGEKSKVAFYIVGGATAAWAVLLGVLGLSRPDFPGNLSGQRAVMGLSALLVAGSIASAILTASKPLSFHANATANASAAEGASSSPSARTAPGVAAGSPTPATPPPVGSGPVAIAADPSGQLAFSTTHLSARTGTVRFNFANASPIGHNFTIIKGSTVLGATPTFSGASKALSVKLAPGAYTFECTVPGHAQAGMRGTLVVS